MVKKRIFFSDGEIEVLRNNPNVIMVNSNNLVLTLELRQKIYDLWVENQCFAPIKRAMETAGFNLDMLGNEYIHNLHKTFKRNGRPKEEGAKNVLYSDEMVEKLKQNPNVSSVSWNRLFLTLEFRKKIYGEWAQNPSVDKIKECMRKAGFDIEKMPRRYFRYLDESFKNGRPKYDRARIFNEEKPASKDEIQDNNSEISENNTSKNENEIEKQKSQNEKLTPKKTVFTSEEVEILGKNPNVISVNKKGISLNLEFRQKLYDTWIENPCNFTIRKSLKDAGFDTTIFPEGYIRNIQVTFRRLGRPKRQYCRTYGCEDTVVNNPVKDKETNGLNQEYEETERTQVLSPTDIKDLFLLYPEHTIEDSLEMIGISLKNIGKRKINNLSNLFYDCKQIETTPWEIRDEYTAIKVDQVEWLMQNPFVKKVGGTSLHMDETFYFAALALKELKIDRILDVFLLDRNLYTLAQKKTIRKNLNKMKIQAPLDKLFGQTVYDKIVLSRRIDALKELVNKEFEKLHMLYSALPRAKKKKICLLINEFPPDPRHEYTRKVILLKIGIVSSVYYKYVNDPDFGLGGAKKRKLDDHYREIVKEAFYYKGFKKGARLVCMLIPILYSEKIGLKKVRKIMKELRLSSGIRGKNPIRESKKIHMETAIKPNILRRTFRLHRPNEVRVTDVTVLNYGNGLKAYLSALMDPVTSRLIALNLSERNDLELAMETLQLSDNHPCIDGGIFHSDQGILYQSKDFQKEILDRGLIQSMSKKGNCWDNATQESFFGHFKDECDYGACKDINELEEKVEEYAYYYNNERGLWDRGRMTPVKYEEYLLTMNDEEFGNYISQEEEKYNIMKERAAILAKKRYGTLGV